MFLLTVEWYKLLLEQSLAIPKQKQGMHWDESVAPALYKYLVQIPGRAAQNNNNIRK